MTKPIYNSKWVRKFLRRARETCEDTNCPSRSVGCVLVRNKVTLSDGYNGPPPGCESNFKRIKEYIPKSITVVDVGNVREVTFDKEEPFYDEQTKEVYVPIGSRKGAELRQNIYPDIDNKANPYAGLTETKIEFSEYKPLTKDPSTYSFAMDWLKGKPICPRKLLGHKSGEGLSVCNCNHAEINAISFAARNGVKVCGASCFLYPLSPCQTCAGALISAGIAEVYTLNMNVYKDLAKIILIEAGVKLFLVKPELLDLDAKSPCIESQSWIVSVN